MAVLLAGRDTTASTLSWTFYELAKHPEVLKRLRQEIEERVGWERAPTYEDLKNMKYLQVCTFLLTLSFHFNYFKSSLRIDLRSWKMLIKT